MEKYRWSQVDIEAFMLNIIVNDNKLSLVKFKDKVEIK